MTYQIRPLIALMLMLFLNAGLTAQHQIKKTSKVFFLDHPATNWHEAIPIGNGSLGGMVYGGVWSDTIKLNEETLWSGEPRDLQNHTGRDYLPRIRQLLLNDQTSQAQSLIDSVMLGDYNECYLPMGDLIISTNKTGNYQSYRRELDMDQALVTTSYQLNEVGYSKAVFTSYPDQCMVIRLTADQPGSISCLAELTSLLNHSFSSNQSQLVLDGQAPLHAYPHYLGKKKEVYEAGRGMKFQIRLEVLHSGGSVRFDQGVCQISKADTVEFRLVASTSFNGFDKNPATEGKDHSTQCESRLCKIKEYSYQELLARHLHDYSKLFHRVHLDLGEDTNLDVPINERIAKYTEKIDPALTALYFQFGRYLLISSSRPGAFAQPAHLQGIWSRWIQPPWSANWTLNCNAEINYWPATITNLMECHIPLIEMTKELSVDGAKTAKNLYGSRGWMAHHNADIWRTTSPVGGTGLWAIYQVGSAWLCHHLWEQFEYNQDLDYLKEVYPYLRDAALFYVDNLQRDEEGYLVTNPSESFENHFIKPDGTTGWACVGATQDMQIIRDLFRNTKRASELLNEDIEFQAKLMAYEKELLPMRISPSSGRLQEWKDDWEAATPNGGQVAHGWGLAVGNQISPLETPALAAAFQKTLEHRRPWESYNCGSWVGSFAAKFWVRLWNGNMTQEVISTHMQKAVSPNMTANFQGDFWEIDGNLGITASIAEMFMQSHTGEIVFLPALPAIYPDGSVTGLRARGGYIVDLSWENGILKEAELEATVDGSCVIRYQDQTRILSMKKGEKVLVTSDLSTIPLPSNAQVRWQNYERTQFVCLDPATWQGREYDNHSSDLDEMKLSALDTDQWCAIAKSWDAKLILFVAKHTGGFCWWQTETSEYGVRNIPWKNGQGDVLGDLAKSCKKYGLGLGIYVYPGDDLWGAGIGSGGKTADTTMQEAYNEVFRTQLTEVLTKYGPIPEVWFDGSCYIDVSDILEAHASDAVIFQGPQANLRWVGNENGMGPYPNWYTLSRADLSSGVATALHSDPDGDVYAPVEINLPLLNNGGHKWFWAPGSDKLLLNAEQLAEVYYRSAGRGGVMLLNSTPDTSGLIPESHVKVYTEFGQLIRDRFANPIQELSGRGTEIVFDFEQATLINHVNIREEIEKGQRIRKYRIDKWIGLDWELISAGSSVGAKRIDAFKTQKVSKIRLLITDCVAEPILHSVSVHFVPDFDANKMDDRGKGKAHQVGSWDAHSYSEQWRTVEFDLTQYMDAIGQYELSFERVTHNFAEQNWGLEFKDWEIEMYGKTILQAIEKVENAWTFRLTRSQQTETMDEFPSIVRIKIRTRPGRSTGNILLSKVLY